MSEDFKQIEYPVYRVTLKGAGHIVRDILGEVELDDRWAVFKRYEKTGKQLTIGVDGRKIPEKRLVSHIIYPIDQIVSIEMTDP